MNEWRHVINDTVFEVCAPNQISIWYPWQEKYGPPLRPLHSSAFAKDNGYGDAFPFAAELDFQQFCERYAESRPYLIEPSPRLSS
ncbi:hypothetical protein U5640_16925 [Streptomyces sp. SS7]|uniref:hypothetical protein n=1 Tax=Streptomyces sp. SS7 TaxID=3108485 RepID=UPI0030EC2E96